MRKYIRWLRDMKANYSKKIRSEFEKLPRIEREQISKFVFISAAKSVIAIVLFRCEKLRGWKKDELKRLFDDMVSLFQMEFFGNHISDTDLIERYEKMLDVSFDIFDEAIEVKL